MGFIITIRNFTIRKYTTRTFLLPKVSSRGLNDGLVHPGVHYADQSEGQQHHDEEVSNQYIVSAVVHSLPHLGGTNLQDVVDTLFG